MTLMGQCDARKGRKKSWKQYKNFTYAIISRLSADDGDYDGENVSFKGI